MMRKNTELTTSRTYECLNVIIKYDSEYAALSVIGKYNGKKNAALITNIRKHFSNIKEYSASQAKLPESERNYLSDVHISFEYVKGHSGDIGNDRADELSNLGAAGQMRLVDRAMLPDDSKPSSS
jgi:ribonuclease HI